MQIANWAAQLGRGVEEYSLKEFWNAEDFEDAVTRASIALYETKIVHPLGEKYARPGAQRLDADDLARVRRVGIFIPAPDRLILTRDDLGAAKIDPAINVPGSGSISLMGWNRFEFRPDGPTDRITRLNGGKSLSEVKGYTKIDFFRKLNRLPFGVTPTNIGTPYELVVIYPQESGGLWGAKFYVTLSNGGAIHPCKSQVTKKTTTENLMDVFAEAVHYQADKQHQWSISAINDLSSVTLGAYSDCVKSLLYARELPMTASGRKRPILHLVHAHKRRMKAGIDIDVRDFLRGTREIVMDGTKFVVNASEALINQLKPKH